MKDRIGVLGCGWLVLGLAQSYVTDGFVVHGSRQSRKDADLLKEHGIHGFAIQISENHVTGNLSDFLHGVSRLYFYLGLKNPNRDFVGVIISSFHMSVLTRSKKSCLQVARGSMVRSKDLLIQM